MELDQLSASDGAHEGLLQNPTLEGARIALTLERLLDRHFLGLANADGAPVKPFDLAMSTRVTITPLIRRI